MQICAEIGLLIVISFLSLLTWNFYLNTHYLLFSYLELSAIIGVSHKTVVIKSTKLLRGPV